MLALVRLYVALLLDALECAFVDICTLVAVCVCGGAF